MKWNGSQQKEEGGGSPTIMTSLHSSGLLFSHGYSLNLQGRQKLSFNQCGQLQVYRTTIPCNGAPFAMQHHLWIILVYLIIMSVIECNQWPHLNRCYTVTHCMLSQYLASWATLGWLGTAISHMCTTFAARFADSAHRGSICYGVDITVGKWLDFHCWPAINIQETKNRLIEIHNLHCVHIHNHMIKDRGFGIHNTYMIRLSWDAMTTKWSSGFRLYMIMNDTVDWSPNSVTVQYEWVLWEDMLHWNTSSATVLISYLK